MIDGTRVVLALLLSSAVGGVACWRRSLTYGGWLGAVLVGTATLGFGGWSWGIAVVVFFVSSSLLSRYKERLKEQRAGEKFAKGGRRDFGQTMANGGLAALLALLFAVTGEPTGVLALFCGVLATVTADTWATELGVLSRTPPRLITTGKVVEAGTSGGVTLVGTLAEIAGAAIIGLTLLLVERQAADVMLWLLPAAVLGGVAGALFDSLLGATVQALYQYPDGRETERARGRDGTPHQFVRGWRWLNNDLVNLVSSLVGGGVAVLVWLLLAA
jgi:uncharacterized protein (TIGR00297 family)